MWFALTRSPGAGQKPADIKADLINWLLDDIDPYHETEFEGYDGWYNNPSHPELGSAGRRPIQIQIQIKLKEMIQK